MTMRSLKRLFFITLTMVALGGSVVEGAQLLNHFSLWPLVRFVGQSSLLVYSLLMLPPPRYNNLNYEN